MCIAVYCVQFCLKQHTHQQQRRFVKLKSASQVDSDQKCYRCHDKLIADACRFKNAKCVNYNKIGHISKACRNKGNAKTGFRGSYQQKRCGRTNHIPRDDDEALYEVTDGASVNVVGSDEVKMDVDINGTPISFTVDTVSFVSIISEETYTKHFKSVLPRDSKAKLTGYTGHSIELFWINHSDRQVQWAGISTPITCSRREVDESSS